MISMDLYRRSIGNRGNTLAEVRKHNSEDVLNATFTGDIGYKRVYILDPKDGWIWTDAKYSKHSAQSILKDDVDYYLQFRPYEHHPVGTYVFIPNDESPDVGFAVDTPIDPFQDLNFEDIFNKGKLWCIVGRDESAEFVRYMVLKCNWNFKWITRYHGKDTLMNVYGMNRVQSSYTSGQWQADFSTELDTVTAAWIPDTYYIFGNDINKFNLCDTRYLPYNTRLMLTTNEIYPLVYRVTKREELANKGIVQLVVKQVPYDDIRDNAKFMICDYYDDKGHERLKNNNQIVFDSTKESHIYSCELNQNSELVINSSPTTLIELRTSKLSYAAVKFNESGITAIWKLELLDDANNQYTENENDYYCGMINITELDKTTISIKPSKAKSLIGKKFKLTVSDKYGEYKSSTELEVVV